MSEPEARNARSALGANLTSALALAVSIFALAIGAWQTRLMQGQARASVWPHLEIGYNSTYNSTTEEHSFVWRIDNNGVGPARIESVRLTLDGKPMKTWRDVLAAFGFEGETRVSTTSLAGGQVIPPSLNRETAIEAIRINTRAIASAFQSAVPRFRMDICYCSVYDDCWVAHWQQNKVDSVARCETAAETEFQD
ncbi:MAG TPA: hypothetical protein VKB52_10975 [Rhodanobacteraceae bacterium]|nr:hypothetical protein [Rhodanobacteraceae bacterium]